VLEEALDSLLKPEYLRILDQLCLGDDTLAKKVFKAGEGLEATQDFVRIVLDKPELCVIEQREQEEIYDTDSMTVILDVYARDGDGTLYDIEFQNGGVGAKALEWMKKRVRFNASKMETRNLKHGGDYADLANVVVIVAYERDFFGGGLPLYHVMPSVVETGQVYDDGKSYIYINREYACADHGAKMRPIEKLIHDLGCVDPEQLLIPSLKARVQHLKSTREGKAEMCRLMKEYGDRRAAEGIAMGEAKSDLERALNMFSDRVPFGFIQKYTGYDEQRISAIARERGITYGATEGQ
jgi:hypothetical protein